MRSEHYYYAAWRDDGMDVKINDLLRWQVREKAGRSEDPSLVVMDTQSVHAAVNLPAATTGKDAAKKVPGRKRGLAVDVLGLVIAVTVLAASSHDDTFGIALQEDAPGRGVHVEAVGGAVTGPVLQQRRLQLGRVVPVAEHAGAGEEVEAGPSGLLAQQGAVYQKSARFLADAWRCTRVSVLLDGPGTVVVRGVRSDPLATRTTHRPTWTPSCARPAGRHRRALTHQALLVAGLVGAVALATSGSLLRGRPALVRAVGRKA